MLKIKTEGTTRGKTRLLRVKQDKDKRLCVYSARTRRGAASPVIWPAEEWKRMVERVRERKRMVEKETEHVILI